MKKRVMTSIFIVLVTILAVLAKLIPYVGVYIFDLFAFIIVVVSAMEICNIFKDRKINKFMVMMYAVINHASILISINAFPNKFYLTVCFSMLSILLVGIIAFIYECIKSKQDSFKDKIITTSNTIFMCCYPVFMFMLLIPINHIDSFVGINNISLLLIVLIFAITMLTDTFAYLIGSLVKGPKLAPKISPNKTISGAIGGLIGGIAGAMLVFLLAKNIGGLSLFLEVYNLKWWSFLIVGAVGSVIGQAGDLFESKLKRNCNVKDSGNIFPGHGGMLDRVDAMIFVITFIYCFITILIA